MSTRPEILFPLFAGLETLAGVGPRSAQSFASMHIEKPRDLLLTLPSGVHDRRLRDSLRGFDAPGLATVAVEVLAHRPGTARGRPYVIDVSDGDQTLQLVFFHARESYLTRLLPVGGRRIVSGKVEATDRGLRMVHPDHVLPLAEAGDLPDFEPVYPLTAGVTAARMRQAVHGALTRVPELPEWADPALVAERGWPNWAQAVARAHAPTAEADLAPDFATRQRLAYDECLAHQVTLALARARQSRQKGRATRPNGDMQAQILAALPYTPTGAQTRAVSEILADLAAPHRMNRLLQGDVGAGKTLVAMLALAAVVEDGGQGALMAPTEILARQHLENLAPLAASAGITLDVLTGRDKGKARAQKLADLAEGRTHILIGTHALFQRDVAFADLRLAVIDEQHRFGVRQRLELSAKGIAPDVLVMTATPIPRSLSLVQYGDMDVSVLDEKPPGRLPVQTALSATDRLDEVVTHLKRALAEGRQAYWVCPLVEESEVMDLTAAEDRFRHLRKALGEGVVGLVHGQMSADQKDAAMREFVAGETAVLVATTVIEVGVNVPNASIMVIERAETFGLAQLHQLRGRVGRGSAQSTCLLLYKAPLGESARRRLTLLRDSEDGFRIAEEDLQMRGAGDVLGTAQSGLPRFRIADLERQADLMALAQRDARALLLADPALTSPRGQAVRTLLWLLDQDQAIGLMSVG